jgi:hypothetical protein
MVAEDAPERRSKLRASEQRSQAGKVGGRNHPKVSESVNMSDPLKSQQPKRDTRAEIAREAKVPERKLRAAAEVKKRKGPATGGLAVEPLAERPSLRSTIRT